MSNQVPERHLESLKPHIAKGESLKGSYFDGQQSLVVTDRRFIRVRRGKETETGREREKVTTVPLDKVSEVRVDFRGEEPVDREKVQAAGLSAGVGVLALVVAVALSMPMNVLSAGVGALFLVVAVYFYLDAHDTRDGYLNISLRLVDGRSRSYWLPEDEKAFPTTLSQAVAEA